VESGLQTFAGDQGVDGCCSLIEESRERGFGEKAAASLLTFKRAARRIAANEIATVSGRVVLNSWPLRFWSLIVAIGCCTQLGC